MMRRLLLLAVVCLFLGGVGSLGSAEGVSKTVYLALWRGCEAACEGFKRGILDHGINAEFIERDAESDQKKLISFVAEAREIKPDLILAWGTTVTLGIVGTLDQAGDPTFIDDIPVVYMIVADAVGSRIIESFDHTGRANVTGTHNRVPEETNIAAMRAMLPELDVLAMLYNPAEQNSVVKVEEVRAVARTLGLRFVSLEIDIGPNGQPVSETIPAKLAELSAAGADFLYVGSSSFLERHGKLLTEAAVEIKLPVLSPYERLVTEEAALLSVSARYEEIGRLAAQQAAKILIEGRSAGEVPVLPMEKFAFVVNMKTARALDLFPPLEILQIAETVE